MDPILRSRLSDAVGYDVGEPVIKLRGYQTTSTAVTAIRRRPCPAHYEPDWHGRGLWNPECADCQATPPEAEHLGVVGWETTDPHVVDVTEAGAVLEPNPFKRAVHKVRSLW